VEGFARRDLSFDCAVGAAPKGGSKPDIKVDFKAEHRGESTDLMEPLLFSERARQKGEIIDLALELTQKSAGLKRSLRRKCERLWPIWYGR
jgi:hypothetical protein